MLITYDGEADILYIELRKVRVEDSTDIEEGVTALLDHDGHIAGLEILDASERLGKQQLRSVTLKFDFTQTYLGRAGYRSGVAVCPKAGFSARRIQRPTSKKYRICETPNPAGLVSRLESRKVELSSYQESINLRAGLIHLWESMGGRQVQTSCAG